MASRRPARHWDESDVRVRPGRHGSRPRTKDRPSFEHAVAGLVVSVDRGRWHVLAEPDSEAERPVVAVRARALGRRAIVPGDRVGLEGDTSGRTDTLARIVTLGDRTTLLRRSADDTDRYERVIVANADQMVVVTALADPEPRPRLLDRCLVAAYVAGLDVLLVLTKADLADPEAFLAGYAPLGVDHVVTRVEEGDFAGLDLLRERLRDRTSVLVGHSGVGKSTLMNSLVPDAGRATGQVNEVTGRGRHTSSSALMERVPDGGWVIDTPGVRSFGLGHVRADDLLDAFPDLAAIADASCPRGCAHSADAPDCALDGGAAGGLAGPAGPGRLDSFRRLLAALGSIAEWER